MMNNNTSEGIADMKKRIMVIDDDPMSIGAIESILEDEPYTLFTYTDPQLAINELSRRKPDLILSDIQMGGMSGLQVCDEIRRHPNTAIADLPIILVTSRGNLEIEGLNRGAVDFVTKPIDPQILKHRIRIHLDLVRMSMLEASYIDAVAMLSIVGHFNDETTESHVFRMAAYSRELANLLGWRAIDCETLFHAASLHDTGKIGIPHDILKKKGPLTDEEFAIMKTHTTIGRDILNKSTAPVFKMAADIAYSHHERWDGKGYPRGLFEAENSQAARIVTVADVFDALTTVRPYKKAWTIEQAVQHLQEGRGTQFDPQVVDTLVANLPKFLGIRERFS